MKFLVILAFLLSFTLSAQESAQEEALNIEGFSPMPQTSSVWTNKDGVAIDGFDTVSYFNQNEAVKGVAKYNCEYQNKTWHFSSAENRDLFLSDPEKYAPQYGGYCAHSLTDNDVVESNPESFSIRDNKLYLYLNDSVADKDLEKEDNIFADHEETRQTNWLNFESSF